MDLHNYLSTKRGGSKASPNFHLSHKIQALPNNFQPGQGNIEIMRSFISV